MVEGAREETVDIENEGAGKTLSLSGLHAALAEKGIKVALSGLSDLLNEGEGDEQVATQLGVSRAGNKLAIPEIALDVLTGWWPMFQASGGRKPKAPALLKRYLDHLRTGGTGDSLVQNSFGLSETKNGNSGNEIADALEKVVTAVEAIRAGVVRDRALTKTQAAQIMGVAEGSVTRHVPSLTPGHVSEIHVQEWLAARRAAAEVRRANRKGAK